MPLGYAAPSPFLNPAYNWHCVNTTHAHFLHTCARLKGNHKCDFSSGEDVIHIFDLGKDLCNLITAAVNHVKNQYHQSLRQFTVRARQK